MVGGPIERVNQSIEQYRGELRPGVGGGHPPTVGAIRKFIIAPTDAEADELGRRAWPAFSEHLSRLFARYGVAIPNDPTIGGDYEMAKKVQAIVVGSPERVRDHIEELTAGGLVEYVVGGFAFGDLSHDEALRSLDLFCEHIAAPLVSS